MWRRKCTGDVAQLAGCFPIMQEGLDVLSSTTKQDLAAHSSDLSTGRWRQKDRDLSAPLLQEFKACLEDPASRKEEKRKRRREEEKIKGRRRKRNLEFIKRNFYQFPAVGRLLNPY